MIAVATTGHDSIEQPGNELEGQTTDLSGIDVEIETVSAQNEVEEEQTPQAQAKDIFDAEQEHKDKIGKEIAALKEGSYWQATGYRAEASLLHLLFTPGFTFAMLLPIFMLGYWLISSGIMAHYKQHARLFSYLARIGLGGGLFMTVGGLMVMGHPAVEHIMPIQGASNLMFAASQYLMATGYFGLLMTMLQNDKWQARLSVLAPFGTMALTNYIMHSLILSTVFYGYAGALYAEVSRAVQMLIVLAILLMQIPLSAWWLQHFQFGPLEWLWRSLTYLRWQPFKVSTQKLS